MITGVVRQDGGKWYVDHSSASYSEPVMVTVSWRITEARPARSNMGPAPALAPGLVVKREIGGPWQAYEHGAYLVLTTEDEGTVSDAPIPAPKVRKSTELRYRDGRWEKCTARTGWVAA